MIQELKAEVAQILQNFSEQVTREQVFFGGVSVGIVVIEPAAASGWEFLLPSRAEVV